VPEATHVAVELPPAPVLEGDQLAVEVTAGDGPFLELRGGALGLDLGVGILSVREIRFLCRTISVM
jgi:hypothetical protein